jgi:hypothetical protein
MNRLEERLRDDLHTRADSVRVSVGDPNRIRLRARRRRDLKYLVAGTAVVVGIILLADPATKLTPTTLDPASGTATTVVDNEGTGDSGAVTTTVAVPDELEQEGTDLQDVILADGKVTQEEFAQAVAAMATCLQSHGLTGVTWSVDADGEGWSSGYTVTDDEAADAAIYNLCYYSYVYRLDLGTSE